MLTRSSFKNRRCIIPLKGFFEWQHVGKEKRPWYICRADDDIMSVAGLYDEWIENSTGETFSTFTIVTTDANAMMAEIHNSKKRMPVILDRVTENEWLNISADPAHSKNLLKPAPDGVLKAHTVSPLVNSRVVNRNTQDVIKPYTYLQQNLLF